MVRFEVRSGIDVGMQCWLGYEGNVFRDWETCISPYPLHLEDDGEYEFRVMVPLSVQDHREDVVASRLIKDRVQH